MVEQQSRVFLRYSFATEIRLAIIDDRRLCLPTIVHKALCRFNHEGTDYAAGCFKQCCRTGILGTDFDPVVCKVCFPRDHGLHQPAITGRTIPRSRGVPARDHGVYRPAITGKTVAQHFTSINVNNLNLPHLRPGVPGPIDVPLRFLDD
jgi:hypothetical protein